MQLLPQFLFAITVAPRLFYYGSSFSTCVFHVSSQEMTLALIQAKQSAYFRQFKTLLALKLFLQLNYLKNVCNSGAITETTLRQYLSNYMLYIIV